MKPPLPRAVKLSRASILVGLLWCVALLALIVIGVLHSSSLSLRVTKNYGDTIQAHYLALAGIEKAKAMLYRDLTERRRSSINHSGAPFDSPRDFREVRLGRGEFSVVHQGRRDEGGRILFGVTDEESRLNINQASVEELGKLVGMLPDVAAAIVDWRDGDNNVTPNGAEADYYSSLQPPYLPRNAPFQTARELLMVRGVTRELFLGEDANQNGLLDPEEDDGAASSPPDNHDGVLDAGWSGDITCDSWSSGKNAAGEDRINVQSADEKTLTTVRGISADLAKAIIAYRGQRQIENLADLLDVAPVRPQGQGGGSPPPQSVPGSARQTQPSAVPTGPQLISEELLMEMADDVTVSSGGEQPGAVNINTAGVDVLACLPGLTPELAQAIISYRKSAGYYPNIAYLLKVGGITRDLFRQLAPRVTARSETFRILGEGKVTSSGARKRIQAIVRLGSGSFDTLSWREDL